MQCTQCAGEQCTKAGRDRQGRHVYRCTGCGRPVTARSGSAFRGERFPDEVIALTVRWYLRYRLSYADVAEWLAERGMPARHTSKAWEERGASTRTCEVGA